MVYNGTESSELIIFHEAGNSNNVHFIELNKPVDGPTFSVSCCCDRDWHYEFLLRSNSDYERIKYNIMETMFEVETVEELLDTLSETFEDGFSDILVEEDDDWECDGDCEHCKDNVTYINNESNKYLN